MRAGVKSELGPPHPILNSMVLSNKKLVRVPRSLLCRTQDFLRELNISCNDLSELPPALFTRCPSLEYLNLQHNRITVLPNTICTLSCLNTLLLDHNYIMGLPVDLGNLPLVCLSVSWNRLFVLPHSLGKLQRTLKIINISDNSVSVLPDEIGLLSNVEELYIQNNKFVTLPCSVAQMRNLHSIGLEWFLYTPLACCVIKGALAVPVCDSLRELCTSLKSNKMQECSLGAFLKFFTETSFTADPKTGRNPLHAAAMNNHIGILKGLFPLTLDVNLKDKEQHTPLSLAIKNLSRDIIKTLLDYGADASLGGGIFGSPLHLAVSKGDLWTVKELLKRGAQANATDDLYNTPLHILFAEFEKDPYRFQTIGDALLLSGARPNAKNADRLTPLHIACRKGQLKAVEWAIKQNKYLSEREMEEFELSLVGGSNGDTPLHLAASGHYFEIVKVLLRNGADVFVQNMNGKIVRQTIRGNYAMVKALRRVEKKMIRKMVEDNESDTESSEESVGDEGKTEKDIKIPFSAVVRRQKEREEKENQNMNTRRILGKDCGKLTINMSIVNKGIVSENTQCFQGSGHRTMAGSLNPGGLVHSTKFAGSKPINMFYLRDKVLNNKLRLHERYNALNSIAELKAQSQVSQIMTELLEKLLSIKSLSLQLDIVRKAHLSQGLIAVQLLNQYKVKANGALLAEIANEIEILKMTNNYMKPLDRGYTRRTYAKPSCSIKEPKDTCKMFRSTKYFGDTCCNFSKYNTTYSTVFSKV